MKKYLVIALSAILATGTLAACANTFHGAGEDVENAGEGIQRAVPPKN